MILVLMLVRYIELFIGENSYVYLRHFVRRTSYSRQNLLV